MCGIKFKLRYFKLFGGTIGDCIFLYWGFLNATFVHYILSQLSFYTEKS